MIVFIFFSCTEHFQRKKTVEYSVELRGKHVPFWDSSFNLLENRISDASSSRVFEFCVDFFPKYVSS